MNEVNNMREESRGEWQQQECFRVMEGFVLFIFHRLEVWQCFQLSPCRIYGQVCFFLSALKCLPYFSEIMTFLE